MNIKTKLTATFEFFRCIFLRTNRTGSVLDNGLSENKEFSDPQGSNKLREIELNCVHG